MAERQSHGFSYQDIIINRYGLSKIDPYTGKELKYTDKWDAYYGFIPVQIKDKKKGGNVELADLCRQSETTENFLLLVGFWEGYKTNIVEEHILYINGQDWHSQFDLNLIKEYKNLIHEITNDKSDDKKWTESINLLRKKWKENTSYLIVPRPKRDHGSQKRIQCAINSVDFYKYFISKYEESDFFERHNKITGTEK